MRVATWNLNRCKSSEPRAGRLQERMAEVGADVWVLTETYRDFAPGPGYMLAAYSADAPDRINGPGECWVAIWSRLPAEPVELSADLERVAATRFVDSGTVFVGTVLPWRSDTRDPDLRGERAFLAKLGEQAVDWLRLRREAPSRLCVAGDFNEYLHSSGPPVGSAAGRSALQKVLAECGLDCLTSGADDPLAGHPGLANIDHIAVAGLRAVGHPRCNVWPPPGTLDEKELTDHYGVWVELEAV
jgi:Endonuclease/Exonuclease/phosphatase family